MKGIIFILLGLFMAVASCKTSEESGSSGTAASSTTSYSIKSGYAQNGPLDPSANCTLYELDKNLDAKSGSSYPADIKNKLGELDFSGIEVNEKNILVRCEGYYFDVSQNKLSESTISLDGYCDVDKNEACNVNSMTDLLAPRIKALVAGGDSFSDSVATAQGELFTALNLTGSTSDEASQINYTQGSDSTAILAYISALIHQGRTSAEASSYKTELANSLENGNLDSHQSQITTDATAIDEATLTANLQAYLKDQGASTTLTSFKSFRDKHSDEDGDGVNDSEEDNDPDTFAFTSQLTAEAGTTLTSNVITVAGLHKSGKSKAEVSGATMVLNGVDVSDSETKIQNGDTLALKMTAPSWNESKTASVEIGKEKIEFKATGRTPNIDRVGEGTATISQGVSFTHYVAVPFTVTKTQTIHYLMVNDCEPSEIKILGDSGNMPDQNNIHQTATTIGQLGLASTGATYWGSFPNGAGLNLTAGMKLWIQFKIAGSDNCFLSTYENASFSEVKYGASGNIVNNLSNSGKTLRVGVAD